METTTLKNLISDDNPAGIRGIIIPRIQRAYAQGRADAHAVKTRVRFLSAIHKGLVEDGLTLDFVYGNIQNGRLIPLDGQQRLTTLWLLHWFAAKHESIQDSRLERFSYNTRYSARDFIAKLVVFKPTFTMTLSEEIKNQGWFPMEWMNDPTVAGMLTMLDEIQERFHDIEDLWEKLDKINFYFRDIEEMKLTDDIYIKMNSRGKPLTDFEHFKAELLKVIRSDNGDEAASKRIGQKIDREWTDLLWNYRDKDNLVDNGFLNFYRMISHILIYLEDQSVSSFDLTDDFDLLERLYKNKPDNVRFLEEAFDSLVGVQKSLHKGNSDNSGTLQDFFGSYLAIDDYSPGKVVVPQQTKEIDIFKAIVDGSAFRRNTQYWLILLYSFLVFLMNKEKTTDTEFRRRLRIIVNLLKNSRNEVVDNPNGDAGNRMPANLRQVESILMSGIISEKIEINGETRQNFNVIQMDEERQKLQFTNDHPEFSSDLFELEDYYLIDGRTDVVGFENTHLYKQFIHLFDTCLYDNIDCAMLAVNDYSQRINNWCVQLGSGEEGNLGTKAWYALFHPTGKNLDFNKTKRSLRALLELECELTDENLKAIADSYLEDCHMQNLYDWRYYYIAYPCFRPDRFGKYTIYEDQPYNMVALYAEKRESSKAYQCMLHALLDEHAVSASAEWYDTRCLTYRKGVLICHNDAFVSYSLADNKVRARFIIPQNKDNIDTVDRISYFKENRRNEDLWSIPVE